MNIKDQNLKRLIREDEHSALSFMAKKYFPVIRKYLRRKGFADRETPEIFSDGMACVFRSLTQLESLEYINLDEFVFKFFKNHIQVEKKKKSGENNHPIHSEITLASEQCMYALTDESKNILLDRLCRKDSFEKIALRKRKNDASEIQALFYNSLSDLLKIVLIRIGFK